MAILPIGTEHLMCALCRHQTAKWYSVSCGIPFHHNAQGEYSLKRARLEAYGQIPTSRSQEASLSQTI